MSGKCFYTLPTGEFGGATIYKSKSNVAIFGKCFYPLPGGGFGGGVTT